jgi:hypothetical protein
MNKIANIISALKDYIGLYGFAAQSESVNHDVYRKPGCVIERSRWINSIVYYYKITAIYPHS